MKFDYIIGNPPYNEDFENSGDNGNFAKPVYNDFMDATYDISDKVELIHPARFLFNAGSTPKPWNTKILNDESFKVLDYNEDSRYYFPDLGNPIKGGIAISYHDKKQNYGAIEVYTPDEQLNSILKKVKSREDFKPMADIVVSRTAYRLTKQVHEDFPNAKNQVSKGHLYDMSSNIFDRIPQIFSDNKPLDGLDYLQILGRQNNQRTYKYIRSDYVKETVNTFAYKVVLPKASGTGIFGETLSKPLVDIPGHGTTETFLTVGSFKDSDEASNALKYISTKFLRTMLGILKRTQEITPDKWQYVPLQNFTSNSDIDWSKSIPEIDQQLYKKYGLDEKEIEFIETHVKEME